MRRRLVPILSALAAYAGLSVVTGPPAGAVTATFPKTIPGDCSTDVTADINAFLASVPDGVLGAPNVASFPRDRCYRVEGTILLSTRAHLVVDGNGSTFQATSTGPLDSSGRSERRHWVVVDSTDLMVRGITVVGSDTVSDLKDDPLMGTYDGTYSDENGISVVQSTDVIVRNSTVRSVWGNGVQIEDTVGMSVRYVTIDQNGNNAVRVRDSHGAVFDNVYQLHSRRAGFKIEPERNRVIDGVEIRNSTVCSKGPAFFSSGVEGVANNVFIHDNRVDCAGMVAQVVRAGNPANRRGWTFSHNTVTHTSLKGGVAMLFSSVEDVRVNDNTFTLQSFATPVAFRSASGDLEVQRNNFGSAALVYTIDDIVDGPGVDAWGNVDALGPEQPPRPPDVAITSGPADSDVVAGGLPAYGGTASDIDGSVTAVEAAVDGGAFDPTDVTCTGCGTGTVTWTWAPESPLPSGPHTVAFQSVDDGGNVSAVVSRSVTVP